MITQSSATPSEGVLGLGVFKFWNSATEEELCVEPKLVCLHDWASVSLHDPQLEVFLALHLDDLVNNFEVSPGPVDEVLSLVLIQLLFPQVSIVDNTSRETPCHEL